ILQRIEGDTDRPLLQTDNPLHTLQTLLEERLPKYSQADVRIDIPSADMDEDMVAECIVRELHHYIDENPPQWKLAKQKAQSDGLDWVQ
ncbi:MAG: shikimate kinase, partial [Pseudomonadota bacterium]